MTPSDRRTSRAVAVLRRLGPAGAAAPRPDPDLIPAGLLEQLDKTEAVVRPEFVAAAQARLVDKPVTGSTLAAIVLVHSLTAVDRVPAPPDGEAR